MDGALSRVKTAVDKFRRLRRRYRDIRDRVAVELVRYRHAFAPTVAGRNARQDLFERIARRLKRKKMSQQNLILGMVVFLVWQRDGTLETLPGRVLEWIGDYGRVAGLPRSLLEADDLESRIAEAILAYGDVAWRVDSGEKSREILPLIEWVIKKWPPRVGRHAVSSYFMYGGEAAAPLERDWIAHMIARGGYPQNPERAHLPGFLFLSLPKSGTVFTMRTLCSSLNIPNVVCTYLNPFHNFGRDLAPYQACVERLGGVHGFSGFNRLAPALVALTSGGGGGGYCSAATLRGTRRTWTLSANRVSGKW